MRGGQTADLFCLKVLNEHVAFVCVCVFVCVLLSNSFIISIIYYRFIV